MLLGRVSSNFRNIRANINSNKFQQYKLLYIAASKPLYAELNPFVTSANPQVSLFQIYNNTK